MARRFQTPSQTVGPFFAYGLVPEQYGYRFTSIADHAVAAPTTEGDQIRIIGQVFDGEGTPIPDALLEFWQANAHGRYNHPADDRKDNLLDPDFKGFGRIGTGTSAEASFQIDTVKPGAVDDRQAPHINMVVLMRGMLTHAFTRIYFSDEATLNAADPVLAQVPEDRRATLIAKRDEALSGSVYRFDIHMQGERETVFFDI
ncbi:MAG: protocatechuate 3,4-dioxygenase subunit alpha [Alphaproteobacteria bacterium]|nr:protocatechuate 3,4-dioxygenase subunit alpha [Alphaproteobacteria bacterium]